MELVNFRHQGGAIERLRPTHALLLAAEMGGDLMAADGGLAARAGTLAEAARTVRERYRCRTVRKELRRVGLLGVEGVSDRSPIGIDCADPDVIRQMTEAAAS